MNLKEKLENLIRKLPDVKVKAAVLKITIKTGDDVEDYESMTPEELEALLEDQLSTLQNNEPDDEESEEYEEWEDAISELEDLIDEVQDEIDSREE